MPSRKQRGSDVSQDTIHRWIRTKQMPAHKVGRLWKFDVAELKLRCGGMTAEEKQVLVLELLLGDLRSGMQSALVAVRRAMTAYMETLWDKYRVPLDSLQQDRDETSTKLASIMDRLGYAGSTAS